MTNRNIIDDIRQIAKTDELERKIGNVLPTLDKARILGQRGVGLNTPETALSMCQSLYTDTDGVYTMKGIIDGTEGNQILDGNFNHCTQLNTLTGMFDLQETSLGCILKFDGVFASADYIGYWYTSQTSISGNYYYPGLFDDTNLWAFTSAPNVQVSDQLVVDTQWTALEPVYFTGHNAVDSPIATSITSTNIGASNFLDTYPIYFTSTSKLFSGGAYDPEYLTFDYAFGIPKDYDFTSLTTPVIDFPTCFASGGSIQTSPYFVEMATNQHTYVIPPGHVFQLALDREQGRWFYPSYRNTAPLKYKNGVSIVTVGFDTTRTAQVHPAKDGGFMIYELVAGVPSGSIRVYRADRTLATIVPAAQRAGYLP